MWAANVKTAKGFFMVQTMCYVKTANRIFCNVRIYAKWKWWKIGSAMREPYTMVNQQKRDFAMYKSHAIEK